MENEHSSDKEFEEAGERPFYVQSNVVSLYVWQTNSLTAILREYRSYQSFILVTIRYISPSKEVHAEVRSRLRTYTSLRHLSNIN